MDEMATDQPVRTSRTDEALTPVREFSLWSAFALAFSDVSPIVGIYSVFAIGLAAAGPAFFWAFPVVLIGQLTVTGVFGDLVSRWPFQGSVYAWSRELLGVRFGWFANWAYSWGLTITLASVALAAAGFLAPALGLTSLSATQTSLLAVGILALGSLANMIGHKFLRLLFYVSMTAELIASLGIGTAMLFFHRVHSFSILFSGAGTGHGAGWLATPFLGVIAFTGFSFVGFESAGSIAEEVKGSRRVLPTAIRLSLLVAGVLVMFAALGLVLAVPDLGAVLSGKDTNPIATTLETHLGSAMGRTLLVMLTIGFTASMIAVQAAVSRAIWASARAKELPMSGLISKLSGSERLPRRAIALTAIIAAALLFIHNPKVYTLLLSAATAGFFVSYAMPLVAAAYVRVRGRWVPGPVAMGRWGTAITWIAAVWIVLETVNIAWPRNVYAGVWYLNWGIVIAAAVLGGAGYVAQKWILRPGGEAERLSYSEPVIDEPESA
jgi:amino acid transporter